MKKTYYEQKLNEVVKLYSLYEQKSNKFSTYRLITFLLCLGLIIIGIISKNMLFVWIGGIFFILFIILIVLHHQVTQKMLKLKIHQQILIDYLSRFNNNWAHFRENGKEFIKMKTFKNGYVLEDLDIVGDNSLYKYLCICKTKKGKKKLIEALSNIEYPQSELRKRQLAIKELVDNKEFAINYQIALNEYDIAYEKGSIDYVLQNLAKDVQYNKRPLIINLCFTFVLVLSLVLAIAKVIPFIAVPVVFFIQYLYGMLYQQLNGETFAIISEMSETLELYVPLFQTIIEEKFQSKLLVELQARVKNIDNDALKQLQSIKNGETYRHNLLSALFLNGLYPYNVLLSYKYYQFAKNYGELMKEAVEVVSEYETLVSLAVLGQVKDNVCLPEIQNDVKISFVDLAHPLISEDNVVSNTFTCSNGIVIITGSNMSGKTSFLRTIGINLILMNAGAYVNAKDFQTTYLKIFTSMRITDDITEGVSSFYRELLRIKEAINYSKSNQNMIALIDEVFRGTNSNDRILGAKSMIKMLLKNNVITLITTHDKELSEIEDERIENYHFSEYYENDVIHFDYKIKAGVCTTTNAIYLMKLAGIIDSQKQ